MTNLTDTGCTWPTGLHAYRQGLCTRCGAVDPGYIPAIDPRPANTAAQAVRDHIRALTANGNEPVLFGRQVAIDTDHGATRVSWYIHDDATMTELAPEIRQALGLDMRGGWDLALTPAGDVAWSARIVQHNTGWLAEVRFLAVDPTRR